MKKGLFLTTFIMMLVSSCDYTHLLQIYNRSGDTILIGSARYNTIDSVKYLLQCTGTMSDGYQMTKFVEKEKLDFCDWQLIPPDSGGVYAELNTSLFYTNQEQCGYFYIIPLETARKHTWGEICKNHLYDSLTITQEMIQEHGHRIEYKKR